ncbi:MAG TPA: DUF5683 domain-containing protein [Patescibacteria group bacterium]|nr:DUF5683 domain-containing protein [Patescibacteria group bacterium]
MHVKPLIVALAILVAEAAQGGPAAAQEIDSLCIHFAGTAKNIHLQLKRDYSINGVVPFTVCELESGRTYRTTVEGYGFERRCGTFSMDGSGRAHFGGIRIRTTIRNALLPGWGSVYARRSGVGFTDGLSLAASLYVLYDENQEYDHLKNRLDVLKGLLREAGTLDERRHIQEAAHIASRDVIVQNNHRKRLAYLSGYLYGYQLIEPWIAVNPPRMRTEAGGSVIVVGTARSTRLKAFLQSLIHPGRGQFYQGKTTRGVFLSSMSVVAGLLALDFHNQYDQEAIRYDVAVEKFLAASTIEDRIRFRDEASTVWDSVEKEKRRRDAAYIALAGLWGLSLLDTLFPADLPSAVPDRYAIDIGGSGCALVVRF